MKLLVPVKLSDVLYIAIIAPPKAAELLIKLLAPLKFTDVLS